MLRVSRRVTFKTAACTKRISFLIQWNVWHVVVMDRDTDLLDLFLNGPFYGNLVFTDPHCGKHLTLLHWCGSVVLLRMGFWPQLAEVHLSCVISQSASSLFSSYDKPSKLTARCNLNKVLAPPTTCNNYSLTNRNSLVLIGYIICIRWRKLVWQPWLF